MFLDLHTYNFLIYCFNNFKFRFNCLENYYFENLSKKMKNGGPENSKILS